MRKMIGVTSLVAFALAPSFAFAQAWPARPITMVVPFAAGGSIDIPARRVAADLTQRLGQQVVVENRSGANGNLGGAMVAKAEPDGYTLMFAPPGVLMTNRFMYKNMPFDPDKAFAPVILVGKSPLVLAANPQVPLHTLPQLIAHAKAHPGKLSVGIPGVGAQAHLTMELMQRQAGIKLNYVPYRGASGSGADLIAGQIDLSINFTPGMMGALQNGQLNGIAVTTLQRSTKLPEIPTASESGFPGFESVASYSVVAPAGTPREVILKLNTGINAYLKSEPGRSDLDTLDMQPTGGTPEDLRDFIAGEVGKWGPIIKAAKIEM